MNCIVFSVFFPSARLTIFKGVSETFRNYFNNSKVISMHRVLNILVYYERHKPVLCSSRVPFYETG